MYQYLKLWSYSETNKWQKRTTLTFKSCTNWLLSNEGLALHAHYKLHSMHACCHYITVKKTACVDTFSKKNDNDSSFCQSQDLWVRVSVISIITSYNMENTGLIVQQIIV